MGCHPLLMDRVRVECVLNAPPEELGIDWQCRLCQVVAVRPIEDDPRPFRNRRRFHTSIVEDDRHSFDRGGLLENCRDTLHVDDQS